MKFKNKNNVAIRFAGAAIVLVATSGAPVMAEDGRRAADEDDRAANEVVTIRNTSREPLTLGAPIFPEGFVQGRHDERECRSKLAVGEECRISVRFVPTHVGDYSGELKIPVKDPQNPYLTVTLTGRGIARLASVPAPRRWREGLEERPSGR
jgi:hypothetical protein